MSREITRSGAVCPSARGSTFEHVFVRELHDGCDIELVLGVRDAELRTRRAGGEYLRLTLGDRTGTLAAVAWEGASEVAACTAPGSIVRVRGRYSVHQRYGPQLVITAVRAAAEGEYDPADLHDGPPRSVEHMEADLR
jgi:3'-5' exoribonuclease